MHKFYSPIVNYDSIIFNILKEAGSRGLSVKKITMHVFNASNSLFQSSNFEEIHKYVYAYLKRNSQKKDAFVMKTDIRGRYRINEASPKTRQLMLDFKEQTLCAETEKSEQYNSPTLFD